MARFSILQGVLPITAAQIPVEIVASSSTCRFRPGVQTRLHRGWIGAPNDCARASNVSGVK